MFDRRVRKVIDPWLESLAARIDAWGVTANTVTVFGFCLGMVACGCVLTMFYGWALVFLLLNRLADGLDGCLARRHGQTDSGGFLDSILDILFYGAFPLSFAVLCPDRLLAAAVLEFSFLGTSGSFLAYAAIAAKRGITTDANGQKAFFYSAGLMEGTETVIFFVLFCLLPRHYNTLAWIFAGLCGVTVLLRVRAAIREFQPAALTSNAATDSKVVDAAECLFRDPSVSEAGDTSVPPRS